MTPISTPPAASTSTVPLKFLQQPQAWLYALWKFSRPHTIIGTSLSVLGLYLIALAESRGFSLLPPSSLFPTLLACLCGNVYIVGLNQLEDVAIDQINKPHLPLASGEFSRGQGRWIVGVAGVLAIALAAVQGLWLLVMVGTSLAIGTAYSLPPIRLKRSPFWASVCIFGVRGVVVNLGLFLHYSQDVQLSTDSLIQSPTLPRSLLLLTAFILLFTFAIAILKDIPDMEGDRQYQINTFTLRLGAPAVFNLGRWVLTVCYGGMAIAGLAVPTVNPWLLVSTHLVALAWLWGMSLRVDLQDQRAIAQFYQFVWKLFFLEYVMFPLICLVRAGG